MGTETVGTYRVLETLTVERLTVTVRAQRGDEPIVLIKTVKPGLTSTSSAVRALEREIELLGALRHPVWPTLLEVLRGGPAPALVLVDRGGHRLDAVLRKKIPIPEASATAIAIEVAIGMAALHRAGGGHGALLPALVELTEQGGVCLYGPFVRSELPNALEAPEFLSPEQIIGEDPDARSDVFLIGAFLYEMLSARSPFESDREGVSRRVRHGRPTALSLGAVHVESALEAIILRCLEKRAHDRFPDLASVAARLTWALRRQTSLSSDILVARALVAVGLTVSPSGGPTEPLDRLASRGSAPVWGRWRRVLARSGVAAALLVGALAAWRLGESRPEAGPSGVRGILDEPGHLRVLARPWAEVIVDGERVDVTPIGAPIPVSPGKHSVIFRHPAAPDVLRSVELVAGQSLLLDIDMQVRLPSKPEAAAASAPTGSAGSKSVRKN